MNFQDSRRHTPDLSTLASVLPHTKLCIKPNTHIPCTTQPSILLHCTGNHTLVSNSELNSTALRRHTNTVIYAIPARSRGLRSPPLILLAVPHPSKDRKKVNAGQVSSQTSYQHVRTATSLSLHQTGRPPSRCRGGA